MPMINMGKGRQFWQAVQQATDANAYCPQRNEQVVAACLETRGERYYVLKEPETRTYLRLSEADYALWWQMDGQKSVKDLLFYNLLRYRSLPVGHIQTLVNNLHNGRFLKEKPTHLYAQLNETIAAREPTSRGQRLLQGFLHTELSINGLDDFFTPLYQRFRWLYWPIMQLLLLLVIVLGGVLYARIFLLQQFTFSGQSGYGLFTLFAANLFVIGIHELAHGLTTKHYGRELNRGGFLIYWGLPAFFVDTRDMWLSSNRARIAVSWAGPHSGLILGGIAGGMLTGVFAYSAEYMNAWWVTFIYQIGFIAYLSVFVNLNPLLELDGYFILMDGLEMPGLRRRAFRFWQERWWPALRQRENLIRLWRSFGATERIFTFYGGLSLLYSTYALIFALYFWRTRFFPFIDSLWRNYGIIGQLVVLLTVALVVIPTVYSLALFAFYRARTALDWLARRDLLARPDVIGLLVGIPLLIGLPLLLAYLDFVPNGEVGVSITIWLIHLASIAALAGNARQVAGSRFQWVLWSLMMVPIGLTIAWVGRTINLWHDLGLDLAALGVAAAGLVAWYTVLPDYLSTADKVLMGLSLLLGVGYGMVLWQNGRVVYTLLLIGGTFIGLTLMVPLLLNFRRTYFALPWSLLALSILMLPWLQAYPLLHTPVGILWLYAGVVYLLLSALADFKRQTLAIDETPVYSGRERLINSFNHFMSAMFGSFEAVFGNRRLSAIQAQIQALGALDADADVLATAKRCHTALLLAIDRLDDLAGTTFTRKVGQAAYDSLPWLEAEALARYVLADLAWGTQLAQGFIRERNSRATLIRQADIFAGFDQDGVQEVLSVARTWEGKAEIPIVRAGADAQQFFLIESGEVGVFDEGGQLVGTLKTGGYFGINALLDSGNYENTHRTLTPVRAMTIDRHRFDPLLRADTTLARQVSSGQQERQLLRQMPLFSSLSPQQLTAVDSRLRHLTVAANRVVIRQGQFRSHLYIISSGQIEVLHRGTQGKRVIGNLGPGEHFGEYALFTDTPYSATYRTTSETELLLLDEAKFDQLVAECDRLSHYVEQIGSGRLIATRRRLGLSALVS